MKKEGTYYQYKDGRILKPVSMGDGDYELHLVSKVDKDCLLDTKHAWSLTEILSGYDGIYDEKGAYLDITPAESDFTTHEADVSIKTKK